MQKAKLLLNVFETLLVGFVFTYSVAAQAVEGSQVETQNEQVAAQDLSNEVTGVATEYFEAFKNHDAKKIAELYQDSTQDLFQDPVFGTLDTAQARAMWTMLFKSPINYSVEYEIQKVIGNYVVTHWTARYVLSFTQQSVVNVGSTILKIENGKIVKQIDSFDLCKWFTMAFPFEKAVVLCGKPELYKAQMLGLLKQFTDAVAAAN